ncbi:MAG: hypothetical protein H7061_07360 [Bdellovibrionaceae bacterium]|nr:hypothetical protein [Bdellovibrio sp.]
MLRLLLGFILLASWFFGALAFAQIISPSAEEVNFTYFARFRVPLDAVEDNDIARAEMHASHMFGLFHSPHYIKMFGIPGKDVGGIGAPRAQMQISIISSIVQGHEILISYKNTGKLLLHNLAAQALIKAKTFDIPLPVNPYDIYAAECTDKDYPGFGDYWYFYDPFKYRCQALSSWPLAENVRLTITPTETQKLDVTPRLPVLRGDNKNGSLFLIFAIHGYESSRSREDEGRIGFEQFNEYLIREGFSEIRKNSQSRNMVYIYRKDIKLDNGQLMQVEIHHMLATTDMESSSTAFAEFFKSGVENADVILYGGHSGLGSNLDIESLEYKAGKYHFNKDKKQIFFFDSCSSYSYYLKTFAAEKTKAKIDVITYGLSSYFFSSNDVWIELMKHLLSPQSRDVLWKDILFDMEKVLKGDTYLISVGGI